MRLVERPIEVDIAPKLVDAGVAGEPGIVPRASGGTVLTRHDEYPEVEYPEVEYPGVEYPEVEDPEVEYP